MEITTESYKEIILKWFEENESKMTDLSDRIWEYAETLFQEFKSAALLESVFEQNGFTVTKGVAGIETAFVSEWSNGPGPVIALIGEYDALPGLGHKISDKKEPTGKAGHGCAHNLLGVGSLSTALCLKQAMTELHVTGTVKYFGCPAEEGGAAKVFMVRDHVFDGIDAIIRWHPQNISYVSVSPCLTHYSVKYIFHGKAAHAAVSPDAGRSALDAAILMDVAVNYLREHVSSDARIHSVISNGGTVPNIVPDYAEIWYGVRGQKKADADEIIERMKKIAYGMAMATETTVDIKVLSASSSTLPNKVLSKAALKNMHEIGAPVFTEEEKLFAKKLNEGISTADKAKSMVVHGVTDPKLAELDLHEGISDNLLENVKVSPYSTDSGDVSWMAPMCQLFIAAQTIGSPNHSWQQAVCAGMSIGHKGMIFAGKAMAMTAMDVLTHPEILAEAKKEFDETIHVYPYTCPLPQDVVPGET